MPTIEAPPSKHRPGSPEFHAEQQHRTLATFTPGAIDSIEELAQVARAAQAEADAKQSAWAARIAGTRSLVNQVIELRYKVRRALAVAECAALEAVADFVVDEIVVADIEGTPDRWRTPLESGVALHVMSPHIRKVAARIAKEADAAEAKLRASLSDGEINFKALCEDMRQRTGPRTGELDELVDRLAAKPQG